MLVNSDLAGSVGAWNGLSFSFKVYWTSPRCPDGAEACVPQAGTNTPQIKMHHQCERRRVTASATEQQCSAGASVWIPILVLSFACLFVCWLVCLSFAFSGHLSMSQHVSAPFWHLSRMPCKQVWVHCNVCNFEVNGFSWFLDQQSRGLEQNLVLRSFRISFWISNSMRFAILCWPFFSLSRVSWVMAAQPWGAEWSQFKFAGDGIILHQLCLDHRDNRLVDPGASPAGDITPKNCRMF